VGQPAAALSPIRHSSFGDTPARSRTRRVATHTVWVWGRRV
jgi:hypothetical protein